MEDRLLAKLPDEASQILFEIHRVDGVRPETNFTCHKVIALYKNIC